MGCTSCELNPTLSIHKNLEVLRAAPCQNSTQILVNTKILKICGLRLIRTQTKFQKILNFCGLPLVILTQPNHKIFKFYGLRLVRTQPKFQ